MKHQPCSRFLADGRKFRKLVDERLDGPRDGTAFCGHYAALDYMRAYARDDKRTLGMTMHINPGITPPIRFWAFSFAFVNASLTATVTRSSSVSMSSGSTASFPMLDRFHSLIARHVNGDDTVCSAALHDGAGKLFLCLHHLGLHFFDLLHQLGLVHMALEFAAHGLLLPVASAEGPSATRSR
jgi:hypothetical protein